MWSALVALALAALALSQDAPEDAPGALPEAEVAARAGGEVLGYAEYDALALDRHALAKPGRAAIKHLLRAKLLERLAEESRLVVSDEDVEHEWREFERQIIASGEGGGAMDYLRRNRVDPETFRTFLRLGIVQKTLARRALGIPAGRAVPTDQQEMWLDHVMTARGVDYPPAPWEGPRTVVARCGDVQVTRAEFSPHLRTQIDVETVREDCYQLLLLRRLRARMPDLAPEALERGIDRELVRRRAEFAAAPKYKGMTYEQVMSATGVRVDRLREDPAVVIAALARLWVQRAHGEEGLREAYNAEREWFDARFGAAVEISVIFLRAAVMTNRLNPRSFQDAEVELVRLAEKIEDLAGFRELARSWSEDPTSRERGGLLGWVTAGDERVPEELRRLAFEQPAAGLAGPVRLETGASLVWIGAQQPAPTWELMAEHVDNELRRRFLEQALPRESLTTWLDVE